MRFKSNKQRKAVMARLKGMNYHQLRKSQLVKLPPKGDADKDGVINRLDCKPLDPKKTRIFA